MSKLQVVAVGAEWQPPADAVFVDMDDYGEVGPRTSIFTNGVSTCHALVLLGHSYDRHLLRVGLWHVSLAVDTDAIKLEKQVIRFSSVFLGVSCSFRRYTQQRS